MYIYIYIFAIAASWTLSFAKSTNEHRGAPHYYLNVNKARCILTPRETWLTGRIKRRKILKHKILLNLHA